MAAKSIGHINHNLCFFLVVVVVVVVVDPKAHLTTFPSTKQII